MLTVPCYRWCPTQRRQKLALTGSENAATLSARTSIAGLWARLKSRLGDADQQVVQRLAGTVFMIRVIAAALAYLSNVLFARWMGTFEFGIFVYVWTWVLLIGQALDLGLSHRRAALHSGISRARADRSPARLYLAQPLDRGRRRDRGRRTVRRAGAPADAASRCLQRHPALHRLHRVACLRARQCAGRHRALLRLGRARHRADLYRAPAAAHHPDGTASILADCRSTP